MNAWIGTDLDGTIAYYESGQYPKIGEPIAIMVSLIKKLIEEEKLEVRIVTARVDDVLEYMYESAQCGILDYPDIKEDQEQRKLIKQWCLEHIGHELVVTNRKDMSLIVLYDDRAIQVVTNTGELVVHE